MSKLSDGYYKFQDILCPRNSKRRKVAQFLYRFPRYWRPKYIKMAREYLKENGYKGSVKHMVRVILKPRVYDEYRQVYMQWITNNEPTEEELEKQRQHSFNYMPKISLAVPMYNTSEKFLQELINSVKAQTYTNWELCLADGSPKQLKYVAEMVKSDERIQYKFLNANKGISENTNEALKLATGEYIGLLDHDDVLPPFSLYEVVKVINEHKDAEFIYSDEDKFSGDIHDINSRYDPHFKPDFAPDTLRSYNYICHFSVFKKTLMDEIGGFRKEFDGSQDYDVILRATEKAKEIVHIPKILYHWRVHRNSTASDSSTKLYAYESAKKALQEHLDRLGIKGTVKHEFSLGVYRIKYDIIGNPKISIVISNKDSKKDLEKCITSILDKTTYPNYEIIVVENNSQTDSIFKYYETLKKYDNVKVVYYKEKGFNYSKINNFGEEYVTGDYVLLLNNDTEVITKDWLEEMVSLCQREEVGIVGAKLLYPDDTVQHAGVVVGLGGIAGHINKLIDKDDIGYFSRAWVVNNYSAVTAACMLVKKSVFDEVGGLDETLAVAFNDIDFCMKVRDKGYLVIYTPYARLYHYESKSRGLEDTPEKIKRFQKEIDYFNQKWKKELEQGDPYFNKNLRLDAAIYLINGQKIESPEGE